MTSQPTSSTNRSSASTTSAIAEVKIETSALYDGKRGSPRR